MTTHTSRSKTKRHSNRLRATARTLVVVAMAVMMVTMWANPAVAETVVEDFEGGNTGGFSNGASSLVTASQNTTAYGQYSMYWEVTSGSNDILERNWPTTQPDGISYWVNISSSNNDGYIVEQTDSNNNFNAFLRVDSGNNVYINDGYDDGTVNNNTGYVMSDGWEKVYFDFKWNSNYADVYIIEDNVSTYLGETVMGPDIDELRFRDDGNVDVRGYFDHFVENPNNPLSNQTVKGTVENLEANAVASATVEAYDQQNGNLYNSTTTDASGNYSLRLDDNNAYDIRVSKRGYLNNTRRAFLQGYTIRRDFLLERENVTLSGDVTDRIDATAIQSATVVVKDDVTGNTINTTTTNSNGEYSLRVGPNDDYNVTVSKGGYYDEYEVLSFSTFDREYSPRLEPKENAIIGKVTDKDSGDGMPGVIIEVSNSTDAFYAETDSTGYYAVTQLSDGNYSVTASTFRRSKTQNVTLRGSDEQVDFTFSDGQYAVGGTVRAEANNTGLEDVTVTAVNSSGIIASGQTNQNGVYYFVGLGNGTYELTAKKSGYQPSSTNITVDGADVEQDFELIGLADSLEITVTPHLEHNESYHYEVVATYPNGTRQNVTREATVTSSNTSLLTIDNVSLLVVATSNRSLYGDSTINASWVNPDGLKLTDSYTVTIAQENISNIAILPPFQRFTAALDDTGTQAILIATGIGAGVSAVATVFAGIAGLTVVIIVAWFGGYVGTGIMLISVLTGVMIGLNVAGQVDYQINR